MQSAGLGHAAVGDGPTLVAVAGDRTPARVVFAPVLADWAERFRVLLPDASGSRPTPDAEPPTAALARDLDVFIATHGGGHAHVLGVSDGGPVALTALQRRPQLFASLTVVDPASSPGGLTPMQVPTLVITGRHSPAAVQRAGADAARATGGRHHVQPGPGRAAHVVGRPVRDLVCAHVADAEAARSWADPVRLAPWDEGWVRRFETERRVIRDALGTAVHDVEHIGSTAVEGLEAKPIVDVMVGVADPASCRAVAERMRALGYSVYDDPADDQQHRFLLRRADGRRLVHAHVVVHGGRWWREHLAFRDVLRADEALRDRYRALKRRLAGRLGADREAYTEAKSAFVIAAVAAAARPS